MSCHLKPIAASIFSLAAIAAPPVMAQEAFALSSPIIEDGQMMPEVLKCIRDEGDGLSPPLDWVNAPEGTESFAIIMHHYPRDTVEGEDAPSQYWLLWNVPATTTGLETGNPTSIGDEGADKDEQRTGYTPPCSPPGPTHEYTITVYALSAPPSTLPAQDDGNVDWNQLIAAMDGLILDTAAMSFLN